jgi:hypothetical protein
VLHQSPEPPLESTALFRFFVELYREGKFLLFSRSCCCAVKLKLLSLQIDTYSYDAIGTSYGYQLTVLYKMFKGITAEVLATSFIKKQICRMLDF